MGAARGLVAAHVPSTLGVGDVCSFHEMYGTSVRHTDCGRYVLLRHTRRTVRCHFNWFNWFGLRGLPATASGSCTVRDGRAAVASLEYSPLGVPGPTTHERRRLLCPDHALGVRAAGRQNAPLGCMGTCIAQVVPFLKPSPWIVKYSTDTGITVRICRSSGSAVAARSSARPCPGARGPSDLAQPATARPTRRPSPSSHRRTEADGSVLPARPTATTP